MSRWKHSWRFLGGGAGWYMYQCSDCGREAYPSVFGFFWPTRCHRER